MQNIGTYRDSDILAQQRRANKKITQGIEKEVDRLHILDARKRLVEVLLFISLYLVGAYIAFSYGDIFLAYLIAILCMGLAFNSLPILIHEGLHGLLAKNGKTNHFLSFLVGVPFIVSAAAYKVTHTNHHVALGRKLDYGTYGQYTKRPILIWVAYFAQLLAGSILYTTFIPFLGFKSASFRERLHITFEYVAIISIVVLFFSYVSEATILQYWFYPLMVLNVFTNIRGVASHALGDSENLYLSSRTIKSSKWVSVLFLYGNYHVEHHLFPLVPSYNLLKLHSLTWSRLPKALYDQSYSQFLLRFIKAAFRNDLKPQKVVVPNR